MRGEDSLKGLCREALVIRLHIKLCRVPPPSIFNRVLSNDPGNVDSGFFCYAATVLSPHRNVLIFTQRMHKPT